MWLAVGTLSLGAGGSEGSHVRLHPAPQRRLNVKQREHIWVQGGNKHFASAALQMLPVRGVRGYWWGT